VRHYLKNLAAFIRGCGRLGTLTYKPGWSPVRFLPLYLVDYGTHVLTGGAVVSWSRWCYEHRATNRVAAFINRALGHVDEQHGQLAGPALWSTTDCAPPVRIVVTAAWAALLAWGLLE